MKNKDRIKLFLVDDDAMYLKLLEIEFTEYADFDIRTFATGELCLAELSLNPDVIILDYYLNGVDETSINGIETLDKIKEFNPELPVVILSSQDKIEVAINCMHHKAYDYVVKSETAFTRLKQIIINILRYQKMEKMLSWYMEKH